jgi:hypothetical protein
MKFRYYVVVNDPQFKVAIHSELVSNYGSEFIPSRRIVADDPMHQSEYNGVYLLTKEEADQIRQDPRVLDVERDPEEIGIILKPHAIQTGTFVKFQTSLTSTDLNWGLGRSISLTENFGSSNTVTNFTYNLNGDGVDLVILDTGIIKYHPEFAENANGTGGTRVVDINWASYGVISSNGTGSWVGDLDGHGTCCASIAAGNKNGWAKKAKIYSFNILDPALTDTYVSPLLALQTMRLWHNAKPVDANTGYKRPTVCTNSWGYELPYVNMTATVWRGASFAVSGPANAYGQVNSSGGAPIADDPSTTHGYRSPSIEAEIASCISAGIVFIGSAGNQAIKMDIPGGQDYDNRYIDTGQTSWYYHRGSTPGSTEGVICVGATSYSLPEHKISFSNTGPRVDIFAPGSAIMSAYINGSYGGQAAVVDPRSGTVSTSTNTTFYLNKISGTSQACPQVAGIVACLLQSRPWYRQWQARQWIADVAAVNTLNETFYGGSGYTQFAGMQGAANKQLYQPFNNQYPWSITSNS